MIKLVYLSSEISRYEISKSSSGDVGYSKLLTQVDVSLNFSVGNIVDVYLYGEKVFRGIIRYIKDKIGVYEVYIVSEEDVFQRQFVRRKITPDMVGKTDKMDIADVVRWLVSNYSNFSFDDNSIVDTGYNVKKMVLSDKISSILNRLADSVGYVWYVKDGVFYFKAPEVEVSDLELDNSNVKFNDWDLVSDMLANDVHVFGARLEYLATDFFVGDGVTTEFRLSYIPSGNIRVFVEGVEVSSDEYEIDKDEQVIRFKTAPPNKIVNVTAFTNWTWRRKITVSNNSGSNISDGVVILRLNDSNFDFTSANADFSDIRFGLLDGTEFPYVYLGVDSNGDRIFAVKLSGVSIPDGSDYEFYVFYGFENASSPLYTLSEVLGVADEFNYDGELDANKWDITTYWVAATDIVMEYYVKLSQNRAYIEVAVNQWDESSHDSQVYVIVSPKDNHNLWIYWYEQGGDSSKHIGLNVTTSKPEFNVGYSRSGTDIYVQPDGDYVVLVNGMYYLDNYFDGSDVSIGSRELHAGYNVEVRYNFIIPIYANLQDSNSIEKYGRVSAELRMDWIRDFDTATLIASKYLQVYREPMYKGYAITSDYFLVTSGVDVGQLVWVDDRIHNINKRMLINKLKYKNGVAEIYLGEGLFDVYKWGSLVEHRVRQLETAGDENFFTPLWQR